MRVAVIGAGVIGLSTAQSIYEHYHSVVQPLTIQVYADRFTPLTTSDGAAGLLQPNLSDRGKEEETRWTKETFDHLLTFIKSPHGSEMGLFLQSGFNVVSEPAQEPCFKDIVFGFRELSERELQMFPGYKHGWFNTAMIVEGKSYLPWLMRWSRLLILLVKCHHRRIESFAELHTCHSMVMMDCGTNGWRSGQPDSDLRPSRGQIIKVDAPWLKHWVLAHNFTKGEFTYIIPG
ncbi:D-amino-acid oxidase-like [Eucyclogobius newberryi]|uniref:D-amino-acid oxidase-like n=1 Tax=Eucyclogobius newberryi TaxID=166745 RepID=UPI003B5A629F